MVSLAGATRAAMAAVEAHGNEIPDRFLTGVTELPGVAVAGVVDGSVPRTSTFAVGVDGVHPDEVAAALARRGIFAVSGHYYAVAVMERLGVLDSGGLTRLGFVAYNTADEVEVALAALGEIASSGA